MQLLRTFLLRLLTTAITLVGVAVIVFVVIRVVPGNPIAMMLPPGATAEAPPAVGSGTRPGSAGAAASTADAGTPGAATTTPGGAWFE